MADTSVLEISKAKPIGKRLDAFRDSFSFVCQGADVPETLEVLDIYLTGIVLQNLGLGVVSALQTLPASRLLHSTSGDKNLFSDLLRFLAIIGSNDFDVKRIVPLLRTVLSHDADEAVWYKVYDIVAQSVHKRGDEPSTPPPSEPTRTASFQQTPWTFNTGSFVDTSDLRRNVDPILKDDVEDNLKINHPDVFDTFFGQIPGLREMMSAILQSCKEAEPPLFQEGVGWVEWPERCDETAVLQFLRRHVDQFQQSANDHGFRPSKRRRCITTPNKPIPGSDWSLILVPGELKSNPREDNRSSTWLDLVRYAREIFSAQDTRRFNLGFSLCGLIMRLWEFDRLGVVGSTPFDVNKEGETFISTILGYFCMSEQELGYNSTIAGEGRRYTSIQRDDRTERLYLETLIKLQRSVAGRATRCWKGFAEDLPDQQVVIKDLWEYEERPEEGLLLEEATEVGVKNVVRNYHETVRLGGRVDDVLDNVRKGPSDTGGWNPLQSRAIRPEPVTSSTTSGTSGAGRGRGRGRSRSNSRTVTRKRSSSSIQASMPPPKRSCSDSPVKQDTHRRRNRVHRRLIVQDVGKSICEARSPRGILTGLLGGIKAHESLLDANILHRDISVGNVMLNMAEDDEFLIVLDLAIKTDRTSASGASSTGTKVFMAMGALYREDHNFMHDLESFFWCWQRRVSKFQAWNFESTENLAKIKKCSVDEEDKFAKEVVENLTTYCTPLIPCTKELRKVVFPEGKRWLKEGRGLYSRINSVLQQASNRLDTLE
ncbi:hypothetical protein K458DRAFT_468226 [Lentithecium fluviatile CBS 122367]|uniref:non-specific serine/threonine protein kinase n=1 Tax=Lentithecium fluviatile CBS 122367 TaxID=1168545 RepID=A0A6G1IFA9_9PLEO|nr:hypothetical protein K458DRAFT_468226 [Lentithecium fluviatile CBS 122367]